MKKLVLTACLATVLILSHGQKVDLDRARFTFNYMRLPEKPQPKEYRTFSVVINASSALRDNYGETGLSDMVNMDGWKKVSDASGHLIVTVGLENIIITSAQLKDRVDIQKDKEGKEVSRKYLYKVEVTYTWKGDVTIKDYKGGMVGSTALGSTSVKTWSTSEYEIRKEAADYFKINESSVRYQLLSTEIKTAMSDLNYFLSSNYGFSPQQDAENLWILDSKKHPEFQKQQEMLASFKDAVSTIKADVLPAEAKEKLTVIAKYFDEIPSRFPTDDKSDKKLRYAAYFNKAKIYLILDNPEAAIKEADALIANGYDEGDGKRFKKDAENLLIAFKKNDTTSRHFTIDLSAATAPGK